MQRSLLGGVTRQHGVAATLDEERRCKCVSSQDGQVEEAVALRVHAVQVTLVAH